MLKGLILACGVVTGAVYAQEWEVGAIGGYAFAPNLSVKNSAGSASTGFHSGAAFGVFGGGDTYNRWGGEVRYLYRYSDLKLSSGGTSVDFGAHTHIVSAGFLWYPWSDREAHIRPFIGFGGGIRVLAGTGFESAAQPLGKFAALTNTIEALPVADLGFGVKVNLRKSVRVRVEVRDYIGPTPNKVITPAVGASLGGVMNDIIGLVGISYTW